MEPVTAALIPEPANCLGFIEYWRVDAGHGRNVADDIANALATADCIDANSRQPPGSANGASRGCNRRHS